jgi:AraC-like DNA-binding protein
MIFEEFSAELTKVLEKNTGIIPTEKQSETLFNLTKIMLEVNEHMNLTAIKDEKSIILKHYVDSLTISKYIAPNSKVIDVGCGAGFPSLPLAIFRPDIEITAIDSTAKRINYITDVAKKLEIDNIYHKKSVAYFICGEFEKDCEFIERSNDLGDTLFVSLLVYADNNFRNRCLLRDAAVSVGYDYAYISKFFKNKVGISFRQYVNCLRILESKQLLKTTSKSVSEIGEMCGFASTRAFDREFHSQTGMTPSDYKKRITSNPV